MSVSHNSSQAAAIAELRLHDWVQHFEWFKQIDSTNSHARRWLADTCQTNLAEAGPAPASKHLTIGKLPALFIADQQTAGRGRASNVWWSPAGCLMVTLVIDGNFLPLEPAEWSKLSLVCGVAAAEATEQIASELRVQLKWPNDLYVAGRKLGGILIESIPSSQPAQSPFWLIGIGLNVHIPWAAAPSDLRERAICLSSASNREYSRERVLVALIENLRRWLNLWKVGQADWMEPWSNRSLLSDRIVEVRIPYGDIFRGRCEGLDKHGALLVRSERELQSIRTGEIIRWSAPIG